MFIVTGELKPGGGNLPYKGLIWIKFGLRVLVEISRNFDLYELILDNLSWLNDESIKMTIYDWHKLLFDILYVNLYILYGWH